MKMRKTQSIIALLHSHTVLSFGTSMALGQGRSHSKYRH